MPNETETRLTELRKKLLEIKNNVGGSIATPEHDVNTVEAIMKLKDEGYSEFLITLMYSRLSEVELWNMIKNVRRSERAKR